MTEKISITVEILTFFLIFLTRKYLKFCSNKFIEKSTYRNEDSSGKYNKRMISWLTRKLSTHLIRRPMKPLLIFLITLTLMWSFFLMHRTTKQRTIVVSIPFPTKAKHPKALPIKKPYTNEQFNDGDVQKDSLDIVFPIQKSPDAVDRFVDKIRPVEEQPADKIPGINKIKIDIKNKKSQEVSLLVSFSSQSNDKKNGNFRKKIIQNTMTINCIRIGCLKYHELMMSGCCCHGMINIVLRKIQNYGWGL